MKLKDKVIIISDNEYYNDFKDIELVITHVAYSRNDHMGYDDGLKGMGLFDLETSDGLEVPFSLYEYELALV